MYFTIHNNFFIFINNQEILFLSIFDYFKNTFISVFNKFKGANFYDFFKEFFKNTKQIGSIIPSSSFLSKAIVSKVNYKTANIIVELGAGTRVFTEMLINNLNPNTKLFVFEINPLLYKTLYNKFSYFENIYIINAGAKNLTNILSFYNVNKVDYILSGLTFLNFSLTLRNCIFINIYSSLKLSGELILFQYTKLLENKFKDFFEINNLEKVYLNFFVPKKSYTIKKRDNYLSRFYLF